VSTPTRKKPQSQLDVVLSENPLLKKEMERRLKTARVQAASLAEQSKEQLRYKMLDLETQLNLANLKIEKLNNVIKLHEQSSLVGNGNPATGKLKILITQLEAENENLSLALTNLQQVYAKLVNSKNRESKSAR